MARFSVLLITFSLFLFSDISKVYATAEVEGSGASSDGIDILTCLSNIEQLRTDVNLLDKSRVEQIFGHCLVFRRCLLATFSRIPTEEGKSAAEDILNYCNAIEYLTVDFAPCDQKITPRQSRCVRDRQPIPDLSGIQDEEEKRRAKERACNRFFGENGCLEDEITNECGVAMWREFRQHYLNVNKLTLQCEFDDEFL